MLNAFSDPLYLKLKALIPLFIEHNPRASRHKQIRTLFFHNYMLAIESRKLLQSKSSKL